MDYRAIRGALDDGGNDLYTTPLDQKPRRKNLDKFRGCLIGGAAGDALGYAVEFLSEPILFNRYGTRGITEYALKDGLARFSDDTQMTLFTASGLLSGTAAGRAQGSGEPYLSHIAAAYREWYKTQVCDYPTGGTAQCSWLMNVPGLYAVRSPGTTCMTAIAGGCCGTIERPVNSSKACGGVMRVAPIGLYFGESNIAPLAIDLMGADAAALTHGHEMGYIPAAMLVHIVRLVSHNGQITLKEAVLDSKLAMERLFPSAEELPLFLKLIDKAVEFSESKIFPLNAIHALGPGWCGDEALAVAIYCALKYSDDFDKAVMAAVNHGGDSDSTGAITGNILGAYLGLSQIPKKYTDNLELVDVITEIADDLYHGCQSKADTAAMPGDVIWDEKYVYGTYPGKKHS